MRINKGTKVLIVAEVTGDAFDNRPDDEKGYLVETSRGKVYVNPDEIYTKVQTRKGLNE